MNKKFLLLTICIVAVALVTLILGLNFKTDDIIPDKETAIKIGRALLEEHFPTAFSYGDVVIDAEEIGGIWKVYNVEQRHGIAEDGTMWFRVGGEISVKLRKSDGKVIEMNVSE